MAAEGFASQLERVAVHAKKRDLCRILKTLESGSFRSTLTPERACLPCVDHLGLDQISTRIISLRRAEHREVKTLPKAPRASRHPSVIAAALWLRRGKPAEA